jgi:hypothetical protein
MADRICRMTIQFTLHRLFKKLLIRAKTIGAVIKERTIFTPLPLFVLTMPIQKALTSGNRNIEFYRESTRSNFKKTPIATMADRTWITVFFPTPLIFRYHLPLSCQARAVFYSNLAIFLVSKHVLKNQSVTCIVNCSVSTCSDKSPYHFFYPSRVISLSPLVLFLSPSLRSQKKNCLR